MLILIGTYGFPISRKTCWSEENRGLSIMRRFRYKIGRGLGRRGARGRLLPLIPQLRLLKSSAKKTLKQQGFLPGDRSWMIKFI